eukprot:TRINITY_DN11629_c0_g1_i1.p1 TRINITY_DN11629_c0_g1~~TRINITY_DN11629_c0_g1_i1.p1  ORF type:complete len:234 (-),score=52.20 TRINITY_DN11629_c0_g1_i1:29-730(-)
MAVASDLHVQNEEENVIGSKLLTQSDLSHLFCKKCSRSLFKSSDKNGDEQIIKRVLSMPSPYWLEMSDMWICGCCNSSFDQFPIGEVSAIPSACLVGDNYLMLHRNDIDLNSIHLNDRKTIILLAGTRFETLWAAVECSSCGVQIGIAQTEEPEKTPLQNSTSFRFYKHLLSNNINLEENIFKHNNAETVVAADIFSSCQAHKVYRFFIRETEGNTIVRLNYCKEGELMEMEK